MRSPECPFVRFLDKYNGTSAIANPIDAAILPAQLLGWIPRRFAFVRPKFIGFSLGGGDNTLQCRTAARQWDLVVGLDDLHL